MDIKTSVQALYYIARKYKNKDGLTSKIAALKLLFFAEKYHLQQHGRMITNDTFFAMKHGPVASAARNVLHFDNIDTNVGYSKDFIENVDNNYYIEVDNNEELDMLSETDFEALDFSFKNFGHLNKWALVDETHKYQEWKRYEKLFLAEITKRKDVEKEDFFTNSGMKDDPYLEISPEIVSLSKEFYFNGQDFINLIEFPIENKIDNITTKQDTVIIFKNNNFHKDAHPHYHISIPISEDDSILLVFTTTKVEDKKKFYSNNDKALKALIELDIGDIGFITNKCVIDCNNPLYHSKEELKTIIHNGEIVFEDHQIPDALIKEIKEKIKSSPRVKPFIKNKIIS